MIAKILRTAAFTALASSAQLQAQGVFYRFDPIDPAMMTLESTTPINGTYDFQVWAHPIGAPGSNKYVRPDARAAMCDNPALGNARLTALMDITTEAACLPPASWVQLPWKTGLIIPRTPPGNGSYKLVANFDGYAPTPYPDMPTWDGTQPGFITIKTHPGHYPHVSVYNNAFDWGGFAKGDANNWRYGVGFRKIQDTMASSIDWKAGIRLQGNSWGGTTAILQSLLMKDPLAQAGITIVQPYIPNTLFVRKDTTPTDGINQNGMYWRDPAVALAWTGSNDVANADIIANSNKLVGKYYSVMGNANDSSVVFDKAFFTLFCTDKKIACFGTWRGANHGDPDPGLMHSPGNRSIAIGLPFLDYDPKGAFSGPDSDARLDKILPVFTNSTANFMSLIPGQPGYDRGHFNLGLEWNSTTQPATTTTSLTLPIRYRRYTGFGTGSVFPDGIPSPETDSAMWIPDQPHSVTFTLTLRRPGAFSLPVGRQVHYELEAQGSRPPQSGTATVTVAKEITVNSLVLDDGLTYRNFTITP